MTRFRKLYVLAVSILVIALLIFLSCSEIGRGGIKTEDSDPSALNTKNFVFKITPQRAVEDFDVTSLDIYMIYTDSGKVVYSYEWLPEMGMGENKINIPNLGAYTLRITHHYSDPYGAEKEVKESAEITFVVGKVVVIEIIPGVIGIVTNDDDSDSSGSSSSSTSNELASGIITIWSGAIGDIPDGWKLCDGSNGTPDLRDKFVVGAGGYYYGGDSGGSETHTHTATCGQGGKPAWVDNNGNDHWDCNLSIHKHTITVNPASNLPPYYALAYIMKL